MGNGFKSIAFFRDLFVMSHILQLTQHEIHIKEMFILKGNLRQPRLRLILAYFEYTFQLSSLCSLYTFLKLKAQK